MSDQIPTMLSAAGTGIQTLGTLRGGRQNAALLERQAAVERSQALQDEYAQRREGRQQMGTLAASMAQAGGGVDEGVLKRSAINAELDALNTRYAGAMRSAALTGAAASTRRDSKLLAGATLLSGASDAWRSYRTIKGP